MRRRFNTTSDARVNKIVINQTINDPFSRVYGNVNGNIIRYIRNNSHRVLAKKTGEGTVSYCRLDDSNSNLYHDGSSAVLTGAEGDVFVKLPKFYYKGTEGDIINIFFASEKLDDDYIEWDENTLIGAYEGHIEDSKAYSRSGVESTGSVSQDNWKQYARNRGNGYQLVDWQMHCVMGCLYYAMYGNTNCQSEIGHGTISVKNTGLTNVLGMEDTKASTNGNNNSINFWGLENWWGNTYEWIDDVSVHNVGVAIANDPVSGSTRNLGMIFPPGYVTHFVKKMRFGRYLDLIAANDDPKNGTNSTGYTDEQSWLMYQSPIHPNVAVRSELGSSLSGGVAYLYCGRIQSYSTSSYRSRLAFRGISTEILDVQSFKSIPIT